MSDLIALVRAALAEGRSAIALTDDPALAAALTETGAIVLAKPVRLADLAHAFKAALRPGLAAVLAFGSLRLDPATRELAASGGAASRRVRLTEKEAAILAYLVRAEGRTVPREELLAEVWGYDAGVATHTLETHVYRLRRKIAAGGAGADAPQLIGEASGYRLSLSGPVPPAPRDKDRDGPRPRGPGRSAIRPGPRPAVAMRARSPSSTARRSIAAASDTGSRKRHQQSLDAVVDHVAATRRIGGDHRPRAGQRLEQRLGQALVPRGQHRHMSVAPDRGDVVPPPQPFDARLRGIDAQRLGVDVHRVLRIGIADQPEQHRHAPGPQHACRFDRFGHALVLQHARHQGEHHRRGRRHGLRRKGREIDARAADGDELLGGRPAVGDGCRRGPRRSARSGSRFSGERKA